MNSIFFWEDYLKDVPICNQLIDNYESIREEIVNFVKKPLSLHDYPKYVVFGKELYDKYWKACPLSNFDGEYISIKASPEQKKLIDLVVKNGKMMCPTIQSIISEPERDGIIANVFISKLIPGSIINPHHGWTDDFMRVHLGIVCDPECKITVGEETKTWEEGKILAFKDGGPHHHSVKHEGKNERIVLSVDIRISYLSQYVEGIDVYQ
jgi:beta-hydroxylase